MLVNSVKLLLDAKKGTYAVPQFNINNLEWTKYILTACQEEQSPVILGVSEGAVKYMGGYKTVSNMVQGLIEDLKISIPVVLHLDHGGSVETCLHAIDNGFTSVMIDASKYKINDNINMVLEVVRYAHSRRVSVEAEVGHIGGMEDNINSEIYYATVEDCMKLVSSTLIDSLAPALGSVHGLYKGEPKLDFIRMNEIKNHINAPLVLHGGTGLSDSLIEESIRNGINKINFNTELQIVWSEAVRKFLATHEHEFDPRKIIASGEQAIKDSVKLKISLLGSNNKA